VICTELRRQIPEPVGRIQDVHRRPVFFLTQVADDLHRIGLGEIVCKSGKRAVRAAVRQLAFDQMCQLILFTEREIDFGAVLGPDVVQADVLSLSVLSEMRVLEQQKPDDSHVWYQSAWIKQVDAPAGYTPPISSVPSYNPAWMTHLRPYSAVHRDDSSGLNVTLDQINANSYDGSKLAKVVTLLPLVNSNEIPALVGYDGAIAISQCGDFPSRVDGVRKLNEILCSLLLGGIHVEVLHSEQLVIGALHEKANLFAYSPSLHANLRLNWVAPTDRFQPLTYPRVLMVDEMHKAFHQGQQVIQAIANLSPLFLLSGYTAMAYRNNSDALNNLWITVEQLTEYLWGEQYGKLNLTPRVARCHVRVARAIRSD